MGVVYEAKDLTLGHRVSLKFLHRQSAASAQAIERFKSEVRAASAPNLPNMCTIHEIGQDEQQYFIVIERPQAQGKFPSYLGDLPD